jgi:hypothetical protein
VRGARQFHQRRPEPLFGHGRVLEHFEFALRQPSQQDVGGLGEVFLIERRQLREFAERGPRRDCA